MYNVGFGDCFLLSFDYGSDGKRHVLIDMGSTKKPEASASRLLTRVAQRVEKDCEGKLDILVATHRHSDHIRGFSRTDPAAGVPSPSKRKPGDIIAALKPKLVIQPWTEDPGIEPDATAPSGIDERSMSFAAGLCEMRLLAESAANYVNRVERVAVGGDRRRELDRLKGMIQIQEMLDATPVAGRQAVSGGRGATDDPWLGAEWRGELISNLSAVENLIDMGRQGEARFVKAGDKLDLSEILPGVETHVLGPPTLEQTDKLGSHSEDPAELWKFVSRFGLDGAGGQLLARSSLAGPIFESPHYGGEGAVRNEGPSREYEPFPPWSRWLLQRIDAELEEDVFQLVRTLDEALNNTSVILLFRVAGLSALFPGDAEVASWTYALSQPENLNLLKDVAVYKVGHHGSRNATPKSLWELFARRGTARKRNRLHTLLSTISGFHGSVSKQSEVPRRTLVEALQEESHFYTTERQGDDGQIDDPIDLTLDFIKGTVRPGAEVELPATRAVTSSGGSTTDRGKTARRKKTKKVVKRTKARKADRGKAPTTKTKRSRTRK